MRHRTTLDVPLFALLALVIIGCGSSGSEEAGQDASNPVADAAESDSDANQEGDAAPDQSDTAELSDVTPEPDVPAMPPQHDVTPISTALCDNATLVFGRSEAATESDTARFAVLPTPTSSMTGSVGDVDADGRTDLIIGSEVYLNCGDAGFVQVEMPPLGLEEISATAIAEVNGDGRPDLMFSDIEGQLTIAYQQADGTFTASEPFAVAAGDMVTTLLPFPDRDRDGRPDHVYVAMYNFPPNGFLTSNPNNFGLEFDQNRSGNALLAIDPSGEIATVELPADVISCGDAPTMSAQVIARHHYGEPDAIYFCTTWGPDCVYPMTAEGIPAEPIYMPGGTASYTKMNWAMGVDHTFTDEGVVFAVSDVGFTYSGRPPANLWLLGSDGLVIQKPDEPITIPPDPPAVYGWGLHFADFDLDGHTDLLYAHGRAGFITDIDVLTGEPIISWPALPLDPGGMIFYAGTEGPFVKVDEAEPPELDDRGAYGMLVGDFYGEDGYGDGCMDVMLTSVIIPRCEFDDGECDSAEPVPIAVTYEQTVALLRNRCADDGPKPFVGVRTPASDAGTTVRLTWADGSVDHRPIRSVAGLGGTVEASVVYGIPEGAEVQALDLLYPNGHVAAVPPGDAGYSGWLTP